MKRYENYVSALGVLAGAVEQDLSNEFVQSGVIDKFYLQFELGWKLLKSLLAYEGDPVSETGSPRDIIKGAYQYFDFMDEDLWLQMLRDRNNTARDYDSGAAERLVEKVIDAYIPEFMRLRNGLVSRYGDLLESED